VLVCDERRTLLNQIHSILASKKRFSILLGPPPPRRSSVLSVGLLCVRERESVCERARARERKRARETERQSERAIARARERERERVCVHDLVYVYVHIYTCTSFFLVCICKYMYTQTQTQTQTQTLKHKHLYRAALLPSRVFLLLRLCLRLRRYDKGLAKNRKSAPHYNCPVQTLGADFSESSTEVVHTCLGLGFGVWGSGFRGWFSSESLPAVGHTSSVS
jgi:hypothetical protein